MSASAIAVTGASGYVGSRVVKLALARGFTVYALGRKPLGHVRVVNIPFDLENATAVSLPDRLVGIVHLAADTSGRSLLAPDTELAAAEVLLASLPANSRFIYVSSQAARPDAASSYGRTKWRIEQIVRGHGGFSVRPGLVYGGPERGLFGRLCTLVRKLPVLPFFCFPRPLSQPIHVDDLADALLRLLDCNWPARDPIELGAPQEIPFDRFLAALARYRTGKRRGFVPVPLSIAHACLSLAERLTARFIGTQQLRSLAETQKMDTIGDISGLGLTLRSLEDGLIKRPTSRRRELINEGIHVISYMLNERPKGALIRRYVRVLEARQSKPLFMSLYPSWWIFCFLAILDQGSSLGLHERQVAARLDIALRVAEASPQSFARFIGDGNVNGYQQGLRASLALLSALSREVLIRTARPLTLGLARRALRADLNQ